MMLTWETGMHSNQGVTLIELLVVMSIMALIAALGAVGMGTLGDRRLEREASATHAWLKLVRQEAMLQGRSIQVLSDGGRLTTVPKFPDLAAKIGKLGRLSVRSDHSAWKALCFFPDGSACPGYVDISTGSGNRRLRIGWFGEISVVR
jgi:type II secretion system protein H